MTKKEIEIKNRAGLHARPAAMLVETANKFSSDIFIEKEDQNINAKSIMGIITLGATYKTRLCIIAEGNDEVEAVDAIIRLFENKFEEE